MTTITYSVVRSYMEINRDQFERIKASATSEQKAQKQRKEEISSKWAALHAKFNSPQVPD